MDPHVILRARLNALIAERKAAEDEENRIAAIAMRAIADAERNAAADNTELAKLIIKARGTAKCLALANEKKVAKINGDIHAMMLETHAFSAALCATLETPSDVTPLKLKKTVVMEVPAPPAAAGAGTPKPPRNKKSVTWTRDVPYDPLKKVAGPVTLLRHI
jgi:hypothetical protein